MFRANRLQRVRVTTSPSLTDVHWSTSVEFWSLLLAHMKGSHFNWPLASTYFFQWSPLITVNAFSNQELKAPNQCSIHWQRCKNCSWAKINFCVLNVEIKMAPIIVDHNQHILLVLKSLKFECFCHFICLKIHKSPCNIQMSCTLSYLLACQVISEFLIIELVWLNTKNPHFGISGDICWQQNLRLNSIFIEQEKRKKCLLRTMCVWNNGQIVSWVRDKFSVVQNKCGQNWKQKLRLQILVFGWPACVEAEKQDKSRRKTTEKKYFVAEGVLISSLNIEQLLQIKKVLRVIFNCTEIWTKSLGW